MEVSGKVRLLLLQARLADDPMRDHEHRCFVAATGLPGERVVPYDLVSSPVRVDLLNEYDAVTVGGAGAFSTVERNLSGFDALLDFLREIVSRGHPTFASCFGYQSLALALGARLIHDADNMEIGTYDTRLTEEGRQDELFGSLPARFPAQMGHKDRVDGGIPGARNLAASERSPYQALRIPSKPVWATQFHPELDRETNLDRFRAYLDAYSSGDPAHVASMIERFRDSRETSGLLRSFIQLVFA